MVQQAKARPVIGAVLECQVQVTVSTSIPQLARLRVLDHEVIHHGWIARTLDGDTQGQVAILIRP